MSVQGANSQEAVSANGSGVELFDAEGNPIIVLGGFESHEKAKEVGKFLAGLLNPTSWNFFRKDPDHGSTLGMGAPNQNKSWKIKQ